MTTCGNCHPENITPADQLAIDKFRDFLRSAGPPDGHALTRLEHRPDLIRYALGLDDE